MWINDVFSDRPCILHWDAVLTLLGTPYTSTQIHRAPALCGSDDGGCCPVELIWKMAGIKPLQSLSETQIAAMAGGLNPQIKAVTSLTWGAWLDPGDAVLKGPQHLGKALLDSQLTLPLLVQVAAEAICCAQDY